MNLTLEHHLRKYNYEKNLLCNNGIWKEDRLFGSKNV